LQRVREVADDAGVAELLYVHHAGYVPGRARGASVFSDSADVLWQYDRDADDDTRYLHAYGRGIKDVRGMVELHNGVTRFKEGSRKESKLRSAIKEVVEFVTANPGCKRADVYAEMSIGEGKKKGAVDEAIRVGFVIDNPPNARTSALYATEREGLDV
jgi:nitrogen fixation/metabolism regulation signal transduction histidine kinase